MLRNYLVVRSCHKEMVQLGHMGSLMAVRITDRNQAFVAAAVIAWVVLDFEVLVDS